MNYYESQKVLPYAHETRKEINGFRKYVYAQNVPILSSVKEQDLRLVKLEKSYTLKKRFTTIKR